MYEIGHERLEKEMDVVKIIRSLRNLKIFNKLQGHNDEIKFAIKNSRKNILDMDKHYKENYSIEDFFEKREQIYMKQSQIQESNYRRNEEDD